MLDWIECKKGMKYFVYCRKSTESEDRQILSIDSQQAELQRAFSATPDIEIVEIFRESASAQAPGRSMFNQMIERIERGDAEGILAWHPDRLARNSVDGGRIIYLLDQRLLKALRFATFTFENNSQGKFMLSITFGYSKYYVDTLSENVKRGNRMKIERGWRPNQAPLGYLNDRETKTIVKDPVRFPLVRRMFELMLTGTYGPKAIALMARDEWGFTTLKKKRVGGKPLSLSSIYHVFSNPFYAGMIRWGGQVYPGKHEPLVTIDEFERVQSLLGRPGRPRPREHRFAYTGMMRCGACGLMVTAENKVNRYGHRYTYYHCTKRRKIASRCAQPSIDLDTLEGQIKQYLERIYVPAHVHHVTALQVKEDREEQAKLDRSRCLSIDRSLEEIDAQLTELTGLRLRRLLDDEEFQQRRQELQQEKLRLAKKRARSDQEVDPFESLENVLFFRNRAIEWFRLGDLQAKKLILETAGSNLALADKTLSLQARKPFARPLTESTIRNQQAIIDDIRTALRDDPDEAALIQRNIRILREQLEDPPTLKEAA